MAEPRHRPDEVAARSFPSVFRGFDPTEVRAYLASVAAALAAAADREASLREELARARAALARPEIDESVLMAALGEETTRVLVAARAAANDIRASADDNAALTLLTAHEEGEEIRAAARAEADDVTRRAEGLMAMRTREADDAAAELMLAAAEEAERIRTTGLEDARSLVSEARAVRERMLEDLRQRVRRGEASFAALQVGRERVLEAMGSVRDALDHTADELVTIDAKARAEAEVAAAAAADQAGERMDQIAATLSDPTIQAMSNRVGPAADVRLTQVAEAPTSAGAITLVEPEAQETPEPEEATEPLPVDAVAAASGGGDAAPVHTGEPSGPVAAVVPIGAVFQEHHEEELAPTHDAPASAPTTGEVPMIAATGTDTYSAETRRSRRRSLRLAGEPAVRAEEQRLASMRYLHRPRTGHEPDVHLPEDGMVVVEPPSADEAVRVVGRVGPPPPRPPAPPPSQHGGPDESSVTVLGPVDVSSLPTRRPPGAGGGHPPTPPPPEAAAPLRGDEVVVAPVGVEPDTDLTAAPEAAASSEPDGGPVAVADGEAAAIEAAASAGPTAEAPTIEEASADLRRQAADLGGVSGSDGSDASGSDATARADAVADQAAEVVDPTAEVAAPIAGVAAPIAGVAAPIAEVAAPIAGVAVPIAGVAAPGDVDALFARLRASQAPASGTEPEPDLGLPVDAAAVEAEAQEATEAATGTVTEVAHEPEVAASSEDEAALQARDAATGPLEAQLAKMVKRLLQDHQNSVLDKLRSKRRPPALELLGGIEDLVRPLAAAAEPLLGRAAEAGFTALTKPGGTASTPPVTDLAGDIAANVVRDLRPRLEAAFARDDDEVAEAVNVAFREWRGERVGRLVGDALHVAFTRGSYVAVPAGTRLRWVADDGEQPCPDCDDNSLAGGLRKGKGYPTGHRHPPAHTGCRCILVRA